MPPHPLTNFEIRKYYQNGKNLIVFIQEPTYLKWIKTTTKINSFYWRINSSKTKDGTYIINLVEYKSVGTHWIILYVNAENVTYFDSFGVEHIPKEIRKFIGN